MLPPAIEKHMRASRLAYYSRCELLSYQSKPFESTYIGGKAKRKRAEDEAEESSSSAASTFLQIQ